MPYPAGKALAKHDLVIPQSMPREGSLSSLAFPGTQQLFEALSQPPPPLKQMAVCMTYDDYGELPLMAKAFIIVGFADVYLKVIRQLIPSDPSDDLPDCLQKCSIAVMRGDRGAPVKLERYHVTNSPKFAKFMRRLKSESMVAILAPDKMERFGILQPSFDSSSNTSDSYTKDDFCATLYLGQVDRVKDYITGGAVAPSEEPTFVPTTPPMDDNDDGPMWKPPDDDMDTDPVWKPPQDDGFDYNGDSSGGFGSGFGGDDGKDGLWQPPDGGATEEADSNGFGDWQPPAPETKGSNKRSFEEMETEEDDPNQFHANSGAAAADAFYSGLKRDLDTRDQSRIFHMRAFNGWVKATQIQELDPHTKGSGRSQGMRVLDLACGKGGDLGKWVHHKRGIQNYVGVDVARGSLKDAAIRARKMRQKMNNRCTFTCADLGHDVPGRLRSPKHTQMQKLLTWSMQHETDHTMQSKDPVFTNARGGGIALEDRFDVISVQFAIHYMMQTRRRARRFFQTCSELLEVGGNLICTTIDARVVLDKLMDQGLDLHFDGKDGEMKEASVVVGNGACRITFTGDTVKRLFKAMSKPYKFDTEELFGLEYSFTLVEGSDHGAGVGDAVNLPEWLNPIPVLEALANEAGLELVSAENFHEFYENRKDPSTNHVAHEALYNMKVLDRNGSIYEDNWEISRMYCAIKFRKVRESTMVLDDEPDEDEEQDDEVEDSKPALDPIKAKKMLPMAMMKAKKNAGADTWQELSSEEKKRLTQIELESLVNPEW